MSLSEMQARLKSSIWQAVAQSGVNMSALSQAEVDRLVTAITENVLKEMDNVLTEASGTPAFSAAAPGGQDDDEEKILWKGRPYLSLSVHYTITSERVRISEGLLGKDRDDIELIRIQDMDYRQSLTERAMNIGDIHIISQDRNRPEVILHNVSNPEEIHGILRRAVLNARKKYGLTFREEM
jgi:membrane protein YdbS with pleckstrin-like domain